MADYEKLFDFEDDLDVNLLEAVTVAAASPQGQSQENVRDDKHTLSIPILPALRAF